MSPADERLSAARAAIAATCLDGFPPATLGTIVLRDGQRRILARAVRALDRQNGCLIAEDVGRGKTFIALALARRWQNPLIVAPASLRSTWLSAGERAGVRFAFASHESLSRGRVIAAAFDGIVVDESHRFRTTTTRRYATLAHMTARVPIVLLSATPLQNRVRDLAAQVALFHGERAFSLDVNALARFVIRGGDALEDDMPAVLTPEWLVPEVDDGDVLRALLQLPAPARPLDGGDAGALRTIGLVRAWASSRAALRATLRSRRRLATVIAQGAEEGRAPTRREVQAWHSAEDVVQLGFPAILMHGSPGNTALAEVRIALDADALAMEVVTQALRTATDPDRARVAALRALRITHAGARIVAFSEYASTVTAMFGFMRGDAGVGMLTAREARIASGRIGRDEMLSRFAPLAQYVRPRPAHESVTLLLATDLLSEGVNLQDASVVIHLDLPWNPARLAQRVGRVRRPGGANEVRVYVLAPPADAAALLDADARLRRKLSEAERTIGVGFPVMPALSAGVAEIRLAGGPADPIHTNATATGALMERLERWRCGASSRDVSGEGCMVASVDAPVAGWLAGLSDGRMVSFIDGVTSESLAVAGHLALLAEGRDRIVGPDEQRIALSALGDWLDAELVATTCGIDDQPGPLRRAVLAWLGAVARSLCRHEHAVALPLIALLRARLRHPLPLGAEQLLAAHAANSGRRDHIIAVREAALLIVSEPARDDMRATAYEADDRPAAVGLILFGTPMDG